MTNETGLQVSEDSSDDPAVGDTPAAPPEQSALDLKINQHFAGVVVRKDLVKAVKGNAIVPSYVLEYLLGQYAASDDEADGARDADSSAASKASVEAARRRAARLGAW